MRDLWPRLTGPEALAWARWSRGTIAAPRVPSGLSGAPCRAALLCSREADASPQADLLASSWGFEGGGLVGRVCGTLRSVPYHYSIDFPDKAYCSE